MIYDDDDDDDVDDEDVIVILLVGLSLWCWRLSPAVACMLSDAVACRYGT